MAGLILAYFLFRPQSNYIRNYQQAEAPSSAIGKWIYHGFYITQLYKNVGSGVLKLGRSFSFIDRRVLDRSLHFLAIFSVIIGKTVSAIDRFLIDGIINGTAWLSSAIGKMLAGLNAREAQMQLIWLLLGIILILGYILLF